MSVCPDRADFTKSLRRIKAVRVQGMSNLHQFTTRPPVPGGMYSRELRDLLSGIGTPRPAPFKPDQFQLEALAALEFEDVLVTAPTGSGKTWIAREEIRRLLEAGNEPGTPRHSKR